ncbi:hypothetical protein [Filimonas effusa]|uniref:DUF4932 domain-containing protein n=1 Tax=Filimonas effusa TaxID=2508721 RepID=A0A4Q1D618_9BACT|nr:hypothetical protein [Filimonas effusa]RXK83323.1 hypothetical protein ESB13_14555 [Filimonas effusa]
MQKDEMKIICSILLVFILTNYSSAQTDSIDYKNVYKYALDGEVGKAVEILKKSDTNNVLDKKGEQFLTEMKLRFFYENDQSDYLKKHASTMDSLLIIYRDYWRKSLLSNSNYDSLLIKNLYHFLKRKYPAVKENTDSISTYYKEYIHSLGYHTTEFGRTGRLYDLLVWRTETDTLYHIKNKTANLSVPVVFMEDFISLGWAEYATLGEYHSSGWTTKSKLYCVKHKYDLKSEKFLISFLGHEAQHFQDYIDFKDLSSPELEYRAKLAELSSAKTSIYKLINFFITNSNYQSENGHSKANYYVISHLSQFLFKNDFENSIQRWKTIKPQKINKAALTLLDENSTFLRRKENNIHDSR